MSSVAPAYEWKLEQQEPQESSAWKTGAAAPEEDAFLEDALGAAEELVCDQLDEEEPAILPAAFARAKTFLRAQSYQMRKGFCNFPPLPRISSGPNGSVDLHWDGPNGELLVNIPEGSAPATYYGESGSVNRTKGSFDPNSWDLVVYTWLSKK